MEKNIHQTFVGTINNQSFDNETCYYATLSILIAIEHKKKIGLGNNIAFTKDLYADMHKLIYKYDYDVSSVIEATKGAIEQSSDNATLKDITVLAFEDDDGKYISTNQKLANGTYDNDLDLKSSTTYSIDQEFLGEINGVGIKHTSTYDMADYFIENIETKKKIAITDQSFTYDLVSAITTLQSIGVSQESIETSTMDWMDTYVTTTPSISDFKILSDETNISLPFNTNVENGNYDYLDHYDHLQELAISNDIDITHLIQYERYYLQEFGEQYNTTALPLTFDPTKAPIGVMTYGDVKELADTYNFDLTCPENEQSETYKQIYSVLKAMEYGEEEIYINLQNNLLNDRVPLATIDNYQDLEYPASQDTYIELKPYYLSNYTEDIKIAEKVLNKQELKSFKVIVASNLINRHQNKTIQNDITNKKIHSDSNNKSNQLIFK